MGGYPPGSDAAHDMAYAQGRLLGLLGDVDDVDVSIGADFNGVGATLAGRSLLVSYVAGPHPDGRDLEDLDAWLDAGGRWLGLHGTSGGRAARVDQNSRRRRMVKTPHHETLGSFFLNHPPVRRFQVDVADQNHPITVGLPPSFAVNDELYMIEMLDIESCDVLLTTELPTDPSPPGFGFKYDKDTSLLADGKTRVLGYTRCIGDGAVAYIALGHNHSPESNSQPFVDESVAPNGKTPPTFRGSWESPEFELLLRNAIGWGLGD